LRQGISGILIGVRRIFALPKPTWACRIADSSIGPIDLLHIDDEQLRRNQCRQAIAPGGMKGRHGQTNSADRGAGPDILPQWADVGKPGRAVLHAKHF